MSAPQELSTRCVIAGGGPAGMMAGFLLARAGVDVIVLEKHRDFLRDFRGDTIHPSTLELMHELGLLEEFLRRPHQEVQFLEGEVGGHRVRIGDFSHLPTRCKFLALMPQWDFLDFLAEHARALPCFHLMMEAEARHLLREGGAVTGLAVDTPAGPCAIRAGLVIGADGRHSRLRAEAGLKVRDLGAPMDVLWFRLKLRAGDASAALGRIAGGRMLVMLHRGDYWQCAYLIRKGGFEELKRHGIEAFRADVARLARRADAGEIATWDDVKLLTVVVDRLEEWARPGLLFIGDAAHAMSPVGGVGINLAIQDAVAAANLLGERLRAGTPSKHELDAVQRRRMFPTRATQALQVAIQNNVIDRVLGRVPDQVGEGSAPGVPWPLLLWQRLPFLQRIPARLLGLGFRPEHVRPAPAG